MLEMFGIFTRTLKTTFIWRFLVSFACIALWRIPRSLAKKNTSPRDLPGDRNFPFWVIENRNPSWLSSLLLGRFYPKKMGLSDISPNESERSYGCESPKSPKRWSKFDLTKYRLSSWEPPRKRKDLANKIHPVFFHTDLHLRFYLQLWKIT